jgi:hypothetical protein
LHDRPEREPSIMCHTGVAPTRAGCVKVPAAKLVTSYLWSSAYPLPWLDAAT